MGDLKELRKKAGLTQAQLAEKLEVTENTIQNWENGKTLPKGDKLYQYLQMLNINDSNLRSKIISEMTIGDNADISINDNVPYFIFPENSYIINRIKDCYATAEELDILGYYNYMNSKSKYANIERRREEHYPLEFSFFEKYGGFNATIKKIHDSRERLGSLYTDALEYAEKNPGCEYRLVSFDKQIVLDKIGIFTGITKESIKEIYDCLKTIELAGSSSNVNTLLRINKAQEIISIVNNYIFNGQVSYGKLDGYIELNSSSTNERINLTMINITDRGLELIKMVEGKEYGL